jgi:hypothetical protein
MGHKTMLEMKAREQYNYVIFPWKFNASVRFPKQHSPKFNKAYILEADTGHRHNVKFVPLNKISVIVINILRSEVLTAMIVNNIIFCV